ncbi:GIY-YIG nuclease family protein [Streptomyces syringium]|uniref:GIY-YIG nuclease family protein n=1 Tax=Streptomyces syringium TaxID=76729 RepID=UPI003D9169AF
MFFEEHALGRISVASGGFNKGQPHLYALSFAGPVPYVKIGKTSDIWTRFMRLRREANMHGFAVVDAWASHSSDKAARWERRLIKALPEQSPRHSKEYYHGADFHQVVALAKKIVGT